MRNRHEKGVKMEMAQNRDLLWKSDQKRRQGLEGKDEEEEIEEEVDI